MKKTNFSRKFHIYVVFMMVFFILLDLIYHFNTEFKGFLGGVPGVLLVVIYFIWLLKNIKSYKKGTLLDKASIISGLVFVVITWLFGFTSLYNYGDLLNLFIFEVFGYTALLVSSYSLIKRW